MALEKDVYPDVNKRTERKGAAAPTPGLTSLDQEREASLADEGGAAGATVESQDADTAGSPSVEEEEAEEPGEIGFEGLVIVAGLASAASFLLWRGR
jgi:hypothetical protein